MKVITKTQQTSYRLILLATVTNIVFSAVNTHAQDMSDEIIVTAQKRTQSVQDVPISLQVISDRFIDDIAADNISDISQFIPGLDVSAGSPTQPNYTIRGINTSDFGIGTDPAVGVYIDGVYSARSGSAVLSFGDIERIEVLKGPQGTLFGRNSAAGAVSIITNKPTQGFEGQLSLRAGNFGKRRAEIMLNVPLLDNVAIRINGLVNKRNGVFTNLADNDNIGNENNWAARASLRWDVSSQTNASLTWTHDNLDQDARTAIGIVPIPTVPLLPPAPPNPSSFLSPINTGVFNDVINNHETRNLDELTLNINHNFGSVDLTSITSWRQFDTENREDEDGTNRIDLYFDTENREENKSWYQELRLAGQTGRLDWLVGASYFEETAKQASGTFTFTDTINTTLGNIGLGTPFADLENGLLIPNSIPATLFGHGWRETMFNEGDFSAFAIYADAIFAVNSNLNLTLGGRYTKDSKTFQWLNGPREAPELDATLQALDGMGLLGLAGVTPADFNFDIVFDQSALAGIPCDNGSTVTEGVACSLDRNWDNFSPRVAVDYRFNNKVLVFASIAKGYKAGGFNSVQIASEFDNEDVTNFEFGIKSNSDDSSILLNTSVFHYIYKNKQALRLGMPVGSAIPQYLVDTSDDQAWGVDLQVNWMPSKPLNLFANAQYIDATFKRRVSATGANLSGEPTGEPKLSAAFGVRFEKEISLGGHINGQLIHSYRSANRQNSESVAQGTTSSNTAFSIGGVQNRTDIRMNWTSPSGSFVWGIYANNIFDKQYVTGINNITGATLGTPFVSITDPLFWGSDIKVKF